MNNSLLYIITFINIIFSCPEGYTESSNSSQEDCIPELFNYNSSTQQAAYFFNNVYLDGVLLDDDDWVGAFNGETCVGSRKWNISQCNGICDVPVLGQDSQLTQGYMVNGLVPSFKIFKASTLSYIDANPSVNFPWSNFSTPILDVLYGCEVGCLQEYINTNISLYDGWNWISLNIIDDDMSLNSLLSSINGNAQFIKSQEYYADYYDDFGWFGSLNNLDNKSMYKLKMDVDDNINISGFSVDSSTLIVDLFNGWNWVGYTPQSSLDLNTALVNIPNGVADFIKSQYYYSEFYDDIGWFGSLEQMEPYLGYLLRVNEDISFTYNQNFSNRSFLLYEDDNDFTINIYDYEFNGVITAAIYFENKRVDNYDYILLAYDENNNLIGKATALYFPVDGNLIFPLMIYGNESQSQVYLKVYNKKLEKYYNIDQNFTFSIDMINGDAINPVKLMASNFIDQFSISNPYPNPFNPTVSFSLDLESDNFVDIVVYNLYGQKIDKIQSGFLSSSIHHFKWDAKNFSSGVYFIETTINNYARTNKVILIK